MKGTDNNYLQYAIVACFAAGKMNKNWDSGKSWHSDVSLIKMPQFSVIFFSSSYSFIVHSKFSKLNLNWMFIVWQMNIIYCCLFFNCCFNFIEYFWCLDTNTALATMCAFITVSKLNRTRLWIEIIFIAFCFFFFIKSSDMSHTIEFFILNKYFTYLQKPFEIEPFFCWRILLCAVLYVPLFTKIPFAAETNSKQ